MVKKVIPSTMVLKASWIVKKFSQKYMHFLGDNSLIRKQPVLPKAFVKYPSVQAPPVAVREHRSGEFQA